MEEEEYSANEMIHAEWEKRVIKQGQIMGISSTYVQMKMVNEQKFHQEFYPMRIFEEKRKNSENIKHNFRNINLCFFTQTRLAAMRKPLEK